MQTCCIGSCVLCAQSAKNSRPTSPGNSYRLSCLHFDVCKICFILIVWTNDRKLWKHLKTDRVRALALVPLLAIPPTRMHAIWSLCVCVHKSLLEPWIHWLKSIGVQSKSKTTYFIDIDLATASTHTRGLQLTQSAADTPSPIYARPKLSRALHWRCVIAGESHLCNLSACMRRRTCESHANRPLKKNNKFKITTKSCSWTREISARTISSTFHDVKNILRTINGTSMRLSMQWSSSVPIFLINVTICSLCQPFRSRYQTV